MSVVYLKQVSSTLIIRIISVLISILYVPLVLGYLEQEKYGIWVTLTTIVNWIRLLDVGMGNGMRNKLAEAISLKQFEGGKLYVSTTYGILGSIFLMVMVVFLFVNPFLNWQGILNSSLISSPELARLTNIVVILIVLSFILQPVILIYAAHGDSATGAFIQLTISTLSLLLIWFVSVFTEKGNIILLAWILAGVPVLVYLVFSVYTFLFKYPYLKPSIKQINIRESDNLLRLSIQFFVVQITATVIIGSIPFVIAQLFSPNEVAEYNIAQSIFNLPIIIIGLITAPTLSLVTQAYARGDKIWIRSMLRKMNFISLLVIGGTILMIIISPIIYHVWIGDKLSVSLNLSIAVGVYAIITVFITPFSTFLNGIGKIRILTILGPLSIGIYLILSILLSRWLDNVVGIPLALIISSAIGLIAVPSTLLKHITLTK